MWWFMSDFRDTDLFTPSLLFGLFTDLNQQTSDWLQAAQNSDLRCLTKITFKAHHGLDPWQISDLLVPYEPTQGRYLIRAYSNLSWAFYFIELYCYFVCVIFTEICLTDCILVQFDVF